MVKTKGRQIFPLLKLPADILVVIGGFLAPISQAALAMSCKRLYAVYFNALKSPDLRFPTSFQPYRGFRCRVQQYRSPRWQFLQYLENRRWKCCSRCLKLHPISEFSRLNRDKTPNNRICNLGTYAGIVDLCPCIRLTHRGKVKLMEQLRLDRRRPRSEADLDLSDDSPHLWHRCVSHGLDVVTTKIFPLIQDEVLYIYTMYSTVNVGTGWLIAPSRLLCPHLTMESYLNGMRKAINNPNDRFVIPYDIASRCISCRWCCTEYGYHSRPANGKNSLITCRLLGETGAVPGMVWFMQTVYSQDPPRDKDDNDRSPHWGLARFRKDLFPDATVKDLQK